MTTNRTLRRSQLVVPATDDHALDNAADSEADEVIIDLEDSVSPNRKVAAREQGINAIVQHTWTDKIVSCRINGLRSKWWYADIIELVEMTGGALDSIIIPKVDSSDMVTTVDTLLTQVERNNGLEPGTIRLEAQIENAIGMSNVIDIGHSESRLASLIFGPGDYSASVGIGGFTTDHSSNYPGHYWHYALSRLVHAAKGAELQAIDGMYANFDDDSGFREACSRAKMLGCDGKWAIHPTQISIANETFAPSEEEASIASKIVETYEAALDEEKRTATFEGEVIDEATYGMASEIVKRAEQADIL